MDQERLFRLAVEAMSINAHRDPMGRWAVTIRARRGDEEWLAGLWETYELLSSTELADVIEAVLERVLGL